MGMYTELVMGVELINMPENVIKILKKMTNDKTMEKDEKIEIPDHKLFKSPRWEYMLYQGSYYFAGQPNSFLTEDDVSVKFGEPSYYFLTIRCNFKNYDGELKNFLNWIKPYCKKRTEHSREFVGYYHYEEYQEPTLIYI